MQVRGFTGSVSGTTRCLYYMLLYPFSTLKVTENFVTKTYHFTLVTEKRQFFVLLVADDLYLSRLRMDANSPWTFLYTIWRLLNVSSYSTWYQGCISTLHLLLRIVSACVMWHWPRSSVSTSYFQCNFLNSSFPVPETVVTGSKIALHLKFF